MKEKYTHEETARLAYELWERRGRPLGSSEIDWYAAKRGLGVRDSREDFMLPGVRFEPNVVAIALSVPEAFGPWSVKRTVDAKASRLKRLRTD